jgi:D-beta-D-heptose 7-phosphate kinase/D-beta-D-heptose 1-phosphate adenosyltransferase
MPTKRLPRGLGFLRKIGDLATTRRATRRAERRGEKVVFTNGCFDLLHPGHVRYLARARALGDRLVIGLNSDASVRRLKGRRRPVQSETARAEVLAALACVDHVVIFGEDTPLEVIVALRPQILAKGADWAANEIVGGTEVRSWGGRVARVELVPGESTTRLVKRAKR